MRLIFAPFPSACHYYLRDTRLDDASRLEHDALLNGDLDEEVAVKTLTNAHSLKAVYTVRLANSERLIAAQETTVLESRPCRTPILRGSRTATCEFQATSVNKFTDRSF